MFFPQPAVYNAILTHFGLRAPRPREWTTRFVPEKKFPATRTYPNLSELKRANANFSILLARFAVELIRTPDPFGNFCRSCDAHEGF